MPKEKERNSYSVLILNTAEVKLVFVTGSGSVSCLPESDASQ